jgi:hypothetical protein
MKKLLRLHLLVMVLFCLGPMLILSSAGHCQQPSVHWTILILARDQATLASVKRAMIVSRERAKLSENDLSVSTRIFSPSSKKLSNQLKESDLPLMALATCNASGEQLRLIDFPGQAVSKITLSESDLNQASEKMLQSFQKLTGHQQSAGTAVNVPELTPSGEQLEVRGFAIDPPTTQPVSVGSLLQITLQTSPGSSVMVGSSSRPGATVSLLEVDPGTYQGKWPVTELEPSPVSLFAHVSHKGQECEKLLGTYQSAGWNAPRFLSVTPAGPDLYEVVGSAPPLAQVDVTCHIDMGRFLFIGFPDYDNQWTVAADNDGRFSFVLDLSVGGTRREDLLLDAQFSAIATQVQTGRKSSESQFTAKVRMYNYPTCSGDCYPRCAYCRRFR